DAEKATLGRQEFRRQGSGWESAAVCRTRKLTASKPRPRSVVCGLLSKNFAQLAPQNLARGCTRNHFHKANLARLFMVGETVGHEAAEFFLQRSRRREAITENDEGAGNFSGGEVRFGDYAAIAYGRMFEEHGFDFGRGHWKPLVLDHLLAAVENVVKAVGIGAHDVAREVPAIAQNGSRGLRFLPVSEHDLRAAHRQFALFAGRNLIPCKIDDLAFRERERLADRGGTIHFRRSEVANMRDRGCLGHSVSLIDQDAGKVSQAAREFGSEWRGSGFDPANFVALRKNTGFDRLAKRVDRGRDHGHHGDA